MLKVFISLIAFLLCSIYFSYFSEALKDWAWDISVDGFTGFVIPDTVLYFKILDFSNPIASIILTSVKNTIGPSLMWYLASGDWVTVLLMNSILLYFELVYINKIANILGVSQYKNSLMLVIIALLPTTLFYMIGALKEIPTLLAVTGFYYHYLKNQRIKYLLYVLFGAVFRYQLIFPLFLFLLADRFKKRSLALVMTLMITLSAAYPYFKMLKVFSSDATDLYREQFGTMGSLGGIVETIRETVPFFSIFAVLVRIFQSIFEPLLKFIKNPSFYNEGNIDIYSIVLFSSSILLLRYWALFLKHTVSLLKNPAVAHVNVIRLYMFCWAFIFPIAGFSFIHHRYIYPLTAFIMLAHEIYAIYPKVPIRRVQLKETQT